MKTSRLKHGLACLILTLLQSPLCAAMNRYECLRALVPISDRGSFQVLRKGVETPFIVREKYIVFPEVKQGHVTGFFIYDHEHAWYYDAVDNGKQIQIGDLRPDNSLGILELTAQPNGLETVSVQYLPTYNPRGSDSSGPAILGSSVMPVFGAFVSRPQARQITYFDPTRSTSSDLKEWMSTHTSSRGPAADKQADVKCTIVKMITLHPKNKTELWDPAISEVKIRRDWIQSHNLDEETFKKVSQAIQSTCAK